MTLVTGGISLDGKLHNALTHVPYGSPEHLQLLAALIECTETFALPRYKGTAKSPTRAIQVVRDFVNDGRGRRCQYLFHQVFLAQEKLDRATQEVEWWALEAIMDLLSASRNPLAANCAVRSLGLTYEYAHGGPSENPYDFARGEPTERDKGHAKIWEIIVEHVAPPTIPALAEQSAPVHLTA